MNEHFERKLGIRRPATLYTKEDALKDAQCILEETSDSLFEPGILNSLSEVESQQPDVYMAIQSYFAKTRILKLGKSLSRQILGKRAARPTLVNEPDNTGGDLRSSLPRAVPLPTVERGKNGNDLADDVLRQMRKDIERDRVVMNGQLMIGAEVGIQMIEDRLIALITAAVSEYDAGILHRIDNADDADDAHAEASTTHANDCKAVLKHLALACLAKASRTHSGGASFMALQELLNPEKDQMLPLSELASPLRIRVCLEGLPLSGSDDEAGDHKALATNLTNLAVCCRIDCTTYYKVQNIEALLASGVNEESSTSAEAEYLLKLTFKDSVYAIVEGQHVANGIHDGQSSVLIESEQNSE